MDTNPNTFTFVQIHHGDEYATSWGDARADFYGLAFYPTSYFDGAIEQIGAWEYADYHADYVTRQAVPTDVTIQITGMHVGGRTYSIRTAVCLESDGSAKHVRIGVVQVLDYWPADPEYSRNGFKQVVTEGADGDLLPGGCRIVEDTITFDEDSWAAQNHIKIIAWAQEPGPGDNMRDRAEVYQAATVAWPLPTGMEWVTVGDPGNDGELSGEGAGGTGVDRVCGAVDHEYRIGKYEVTNGQYIEFLNAVATTDTHALYWSSMSTEPAGGIDRAGASGSYTYGPKGGDANWLNRPVNFVQWHDALRFANWMHNGKPTGAQDASTTEDGAYDMSLGAAAVRKAGAVVFVANEDEWYKAAYYKGGGTSAGYWDYPTQSDALPTGEAPPGTDPTNGSANFYYYDTYVDPTYYTTEVGAYTFKPSESAYGTFDQGGNVFEFNDGLIGELRVMRGSSFDGAPNFLRADFRLGSMPSVGAPYLGFRLASFEDCDGNRIPDVCDWDCGALGGQCNFEGCGQALDCNTDGIIDVCELARGASPDCMLNGIPNECDIGDCAGEDWCADCDTNGLPDGCQPDCTLDGIPDVCVISSCPAEDKSCWDCNANAVPDGCDLDSGDPDGNGRISLDCNANDVPDECDQRPPALPDAPHDAPKNRYISIDPTTCETSAVALQVTLTSMLRCSDDNRRACVVDDDCPGVCDTNRDLQCETDSFCGADGPCVDTGPCVEHPAVGSCSVDGEACTTDGDCLGGQTCLRVIKWVDEPVVRACSPLDDCTDQWFANLVDTPVSRVWTEDKVHVVGCEVVPAAVYEVRSSACEAKFGDPLTIGTIERPQVHYGDCVGPVAGDPPVYTPPDGFTNVVDVQAYLFANQGSTAVPSTTWVDLHGAVIGSGCTEGDCIVPQQIINVGDLQTIKFGFAGQMYVETPGQEDPNNCP